MSGYVQKHYVDMASRAGCNGFLAKPFPLDRLLAEVQRLLGMESQLTRTEHILLVEDDDEVRASLAAVLEDEGYPVDLARNGREALEHLRTGEPPRLILLDLMMPVMDGWQFCAAQAEDPALAPIPVVVISASSNLRQSISSLHVADYLPKPIEVPQLINAVQRFF
jgi:CheY-like chemotaxis protein